MDSRLQRHFTELAGNAPARTHGRRNEPDEFFHKWIALRWLCHELYDRDLSFPWRDIDDEHHVAPETSATLVPVTGAHRPGDHADLLRRLTIYSELVVVVVPGHVSGTNTSYSLPGKIMTDDAERAAAEEIFALNRRHADLVETRRCVFLPSTLALHWGSVSEDISYGYTAPLLSTGDAGAYCPVNGNRSVFGDPATFLMCKQVVLPYFPDADLLTLARLQDEETDAFTRFMCFLKSRVAALGQTDSERAGRDLLDEIDHGVAGLSLEAEKLARSRVLRGAQVATFAVSLGALLFPATPVVTTVAGVLGSVSALDMLREWQARKNAETELRRSDFYIPLLLRRMADERRGHR